MLGFLLLGRWIVTSKLGRVLTAIRDAETRVMFSGYNPLYYKLFIWTLSAVICGIAGAPGSAKGSSTRAALGESGGASGAARAPRTCDHAYRMRRGSSGRSILGY